MTDSGLPPGLTPELLEQMRQVGLRLDRTGTLWHQGTEVSHPRLRQAFLRWLDVRDDGKDIIRLDDKRYAYVTVDDAHLRARSARWDGDRCFILWDDAAEAELDYASLRQQSEDHALYAGVRGKLRGRIGGPAYHAIAERIEPEGSSFVLVAAGQRWPIAGAE